MLRYGTVRTRRDNDIAYAAIGPTEDDGEAPLLMVHPINLRKECWLGILPALAARRQCVSVDLAGHGESSDADEFTVEGWVSDCVDVAAALDLDRFHVVGGSLGGTIALCLAAELPTKVLSVTAMGSSLGGHTDAEEAPSLADLLDSRTVDELFALLAEAAVAPGSPAALVTTVQHLTNAHGEPIVRRILRAVEASDATARVTSARCPVLVLSGEFDTTCTPAMGRRMADSVGGRHQVLPDVGHLPMLEDAATVLEHLQTQLDSAEADVPPR